MYLGTLLLQDNRQKNCVIAMVNLIFRAVITLLTPKLKKFVITRELWPKILRYIKLTEIHFKNMFITRFIGNYISIC